MMSGAAQPSESELRELIPLAIACGFKPPVETDVLDLQSSAFHEAGHVIAGLALGRTLRTVSIKPGHESTEFEIIEPDSYEAVVKLVKTGLGGPIAEHQRFGVSWGFLGDIRVIRGQIAPYLNGRKEERILSPLGEFVQKAIKRNRASLDAVAGALIAKTTLGKTEVAGLVSIE